MDGFFKEDLLERLARLDEDADLLFDEERRVTMVIVGGSALLLLETITCVTHDIDALNDFRYAEFLDTYKTYVGRWRPCES